jgi:hypothetical protein
MRDARTHARTHARTLARLLRMYGMCIVYSVYIHVADETALPYLTISYCTLLYIHTYILCIDDCIASSHLDITYTLLETYSIGKKMT